MIRGSTDCNSSTQREVLSQLRLTTLDDNEDIDARSVKSGKTQRVPVEVHMPNEGAEAAPFFPVIKTATLSPGSSSTTTTGARR